MSVLARAARQISPTNCSRRCAMSSVDIWKNPPHEEKAMHDSHSDALVFFGATGDLAYKKIFPALQAMVKRGHLDVPIIGVAKAGWTLELLRYVDGDYREATTFEAIREQLGTAERPAYYLAIPPTLFPVVVDQLRRLG